MKTIAQLSQEFDELFTQFSNIDPEALTVYQEITHEELFKVADNISRTFDTIDSGVEHSELKLAEYLSGEISKFRGYLVGLQSEVLQNV